MKVSFALMLASMYALAAAPAMAGQQFGTVNVLNVRDSDGLLWVNLTGSPSDRPLCAANTTYWIIPNETTDTGKRLYEMLLAANVAGRAITIHGKNTCNRWGDGEDIDFIEMWDASATIAPR